MHPLRHPRNSIIIGIAFALIGAILAACGQVSFKHGADGRAVLLDFMNLWILLGLVLYFAGTVFWILALSVVPLTVIVREPPAFSATTTFGAWLAAVAALGLGTGLVYPTLLAAIGDVAHPSWRASAVGVYRLWRDLGYAVGALLAGALADAFGMSTSIVVVAAITAASGLAVAIRMPETLARSP